jgi:hypothetical protein
VLAPSYELAYHTRWPDLPRLCEMWDASKI